MIRLSRAGWNNVLIFSTLIMIMLLNGLHKNLWDEPSLKEATLLDNKTFALTINYTASEVDSSLYRLERAGREWRYMADEQTSHVLDASAIYALWKEKPFPIVDEAIALHHLNGEEPIQTASVWIAGEANPRSYQLFSATPSMPNTYIRGPSYIKAGEFLWFEVPKDHISQLGFMHK